MSRLLRANFARLWKSGIFRLTMAFSAGLSIFCIIMRYIDSKSNADIYASLDESYRNADGLIFIGGVYLVFAAAVFTGIFVGTEYSDGTLRNKIITGHSRGAIYLSNLIVCMTANAIIHLTYIILTLLLGNLLIGGTTMSVKELFIFTLSGTAAMLGITALMTMFSMLIPSKSAGAVVVLISVVVMLMATLTVFSRLTEPEYYDGYSYTNEETGETVTVDRAKNTSYLTGTKRKIYEFLNGFIPTSQLYRIAMNDSSDLDVMALYSGTILLITTGAGIIVFRRKNLK